MPMTDDEAFAFYADPANQRPGARVPKRASTAMTGHVPVRFSDDLIARVKAIAAQDGQTVSSWIRHVVLREVERRQPPTTGPTGPVLTIQWEAAPLLGVTTKGWEPSSPSPNSNGASSASAPATPYRNTQPKDTE